MCNYSFTAMMSSADANENCYKNFRRSYRYFGQSVSSWHTPVRNQAVQGSVCRCFQDLEKLRKAQTTAWTFWIKARFIGYLCTRVTSTVSSASESSTSTTSTKRNASDSLVAFSTPRSRPPTRKRPMVVRTDRDARIVPTAKIPCIYRPGDKRCHCTDGNLIHASVWEIEGVSSAWCVLTNQIFSAEISQFSKILYYIHETRTYLKAGGSSEHCQWVFMVKILLSQQT